MQRFLLITIFVGLLLFFVIFKLKLNINIEHNPNLIGLDMEDQAKLDQWVNKQEKLDEEPMFNNDDADLADAKHYDLYNLPDHQTTHKTKPITVLEEHVAHV